MPETGNVRMRSPCLAEEATILSVVPYLRNKNLEIRPRRRTLSQRIWSRVLRYASAAEHRETLKSDAQIVVSEQIVENAMVLRNVPASARTVLDFGGVESLLPLTFAALGYCVTVWDQRAYPFAHPLLTAVRGDILLPTLPQLGSFDLIVSVSTIEHLGLGAYGDIVVDDADIRGVSVLYSLLRPGGRMIVTIPAGRTAVHPGFRVYDRERIARVFPYPRVVHYFRKATRDAVWQRCEEAEVQQVEYEAPTQSLPVDAVAVVILDKGNQPPSS
jgi:hypothetical protein